MSGSSPALRPTTRPTTSPDCYAHLLRDVEDLEKEFPQQPEIQQFVAELAPLLARAMHLRGFKLSPAQFRRQAAQTRAQIEAVTSAPAQHPGIQKIQSLFREKAHRLYHWAKDRAVPADNNRAERELRPLVIARKVSSEALPAGRGGFPCLQLRRAQEA